MGLGKGGSILVHLGTNNAEEKGTIAKVKKYRQLVRTLKQTQFEQIILSGISPVIGSRGHGKSHGYQNCRRMALSKQVQEVGFVAIFCWEG